MASSRFASLALSPSLARLTASMLLRLHAAVARTTARANTGFLLMARESLRLCTFPRPERSFAFFALLRALLARVEHDRVDDRDHAALGLRARQIAEPTHDALNDALIRQIAAAVGRQGDRAAPVDDELHRDAPLEVGVVAHPVLVAEPEPTEVLADD